MRTCNGTCHTANGCLCERAPGAAVPAAFPQRRWSDAAPRHRPMFFADPAVVEAVEDEVEQARRDRDDWWLVARIVFWVMVAGVGVIALTRVAVEAARLL